MSRKPLSQVLTPRQEGETPTPDLLKHFREDSNAYGMLKSDQEDRVDLFITAAVIVITVMVGIVCFAPYIVGWLEAR